MWTERFTERKSGRLEPIGDGLLAFVPNPLPPQLDWTDELVARLGDAREALARLGAHKELVIVPGATHLFEEPGTLERAAQLASDWFVRYLGAPGTG